MRKKWIKPETRLNERGYLEIVEPKFSSYEEEAEWWNRIDTSEILEKGEPVELVFTKPRRRCENCGGWVRTRRADVELLGGKIVVRRVKQYHCDRCGRTELSPEGLAEVAKVEKALKGKLVAKEAAG
jgi:hypothetical protein